MNKEDYLRLLELAIQEIPNYMVGSAAIGTMVLAWRKHIDSKQKKRKPQPRKHKK